MFSPLFKIRPYLFHIQYKNNLALVKTKEISSTYSSKTKNTIFILVFLYALFGLSNFALIIFANSIVA